MLDYVQIKDPGEPLVTIDRHLYLTEDRSRVVEEGNPAGRWLWASPGQQVARREAERLGALQPAPAPLPEPKQVSPRADKQRRPGADKAGQPPAPAGPA